MTGTALTGARRIEEASLNAWPALQQVLLDGWVLRFAKGFTKRANSIVPLYPTAGDEDGAQLSDELLLAKIRYCENLYAREQLTTVFRLTSINQALSEPGTPTDGAYRLDALLSERGYKLDERNFVLACDLATATAHPPATAGSPELKLVSLDQWLSAYCRITGMDQPARTLHGYILRAISGECGFALLSDAAGEPVACGLAVLERELVGLFDVVTHPDHRRRGHSRRLLAGIFHWAREQGAERAYLQVVRDNAPALALYGQLGFTHCYDYWYRIAP